MKKLLLVSIVLLVAGIGLILYGDPVFSTGAGSGTEIIGTNSTPGGGVPPAQLPNSHCTTGPNGGTACTGGAPGGSSGNAETLAIAGIALCGAGLFLSAVESFAKPASPDASKVVA